MLVGPVKVLKVYVSVLIAHTCHCTTTVGWLWSSDTIITILPSSSNIVTRAIVGRVIIFDVIGNRIDRLMLNVSVFSNIVSSMMVMSSHCLRPAGVNVNTLNTVVKSSGSVRYGGENDRFELRRRAHRKCVINNNTLHVIIDDGVVEYSVVSAIHYGEPLSHTRWHPHPCRYATTPTSTAWNISLPTPSGGRLEWSNPQVFDLHLIKCKLPFVFWHMVQLCCYSFPSTRSVTLAYILYC